MIEINKVFNQDCRDGLRQIEDETIDLVLTDPPYGINKGKCIGDDNFYLFKATIPEIYRILKNDSFYLTFGSIERINDIMSAACLFFKYKWMMIYYVNNSMNRGKLGFNHYIPLFVFEKGEPKIKKQMKDSYETSASKLINRDHPYEKDIKFLRKVIEGFSSEGDIILDPFCGSGNTILAAKQLNRKYIGFDIVGSYCDITQNKLFGTRITDYIDISV